MSFFGFKSSRELEEEKKRAAQQAKSDLIRQNQTNLSNLARGSQFSFRIPFFDVFDPRLMDFPVPAAVEVSVTYAIEDLNLFQSMNKAEGYSDETFKQKLRATVTKYVKGIVTNVPSEAQIPAIQLERKIMEVSDFVQQRATPQIENALGVKIRCLDVTAIEIQKDSRGYRELRALTADLERENKMAQHSANLSNFKLQNQLNQDQMKMQSSLGLDAMKRQQELQLGGQEQLQDMNLENQREMMRIQREEMQRAQRLQTEQTFLGAHQANLTSDLLNKATDSGFNVFRQQQPKMGMGGMNQMGMGGMPQMGGMPPMGAPKAFPQVQYMVGVNGQPQGPFDWNQLQQLVQSGQLTQQTQVWKQGMPQWAMAGQVPELQPLFAGQAPAINGMPPMM